MTQVQSQEQLEDRMKCDFGQLSQPTSLGTLTLVWALAVDQGQSYLLKFKLRPVQVEGGEPLK